MIVSTTVPGDFIRHRERIESTVNLVIKIDSASWQKIYTKYGPMGAEALNLISNQSHPLH